MWTGLIPDRRIDRFVLCLCLFDLTGYTQVQTQELATALVQALLNDQEVVSAGALFLREASANPETQVGMAL